MRAWLTPLTEALQRGEAAVLVHVLELRGSAPREVGAQMLVTETGLSGTIGGGELEHAAELRARELLQTGGGGIEQYALGPELNQCCGGRVTLAYESFAPADAAWLRKLATAAADPVPVVRMLSFDVAGAMRRDWAEGSEDEPLYQVSMAGPGVTIRERLNPPAQAVFLFGAGHVGRALARALQPLGFALTWIDARAGQFPEPPLAGARALALAMPELVVDEAPPGTIFLVMTHSHPLDEAVCEAVLRRGDFAYLGLIGSETKRARFRKRLAEAGLAAALIDRMVCPIGLPQIAGKEPAIIAASVAADLLILRQHHFRPAVPEHHGR
jgi:xanthine dehydrogenase accessory factor